ncbi:hypothetical protein JCM19046_1693 [Bacillus sp. JCM 19046]|nr:hypothetical protein JCM19046_1693 [Bacillus sp. JCM 19046]
MMETNVLIVEDDEEIGQLLSLIVTKAGMKVTRAYSGTELCCRFKPIRLIWFCLI